MSRPIIIIAFTTLLACSSYNRAWLQKFPLPEQFQSDCCWQALQSLAITYQQENYALTVAIAHQQKELTVAVMGELNYRLITLHQDATGVSVEQAEILPENLPAEFFLALIHALWVPANEPLSDAEWALVQVNDRRVIRYRDQDLVMMDTPSRGLPTTGEIIHIQHLTRPLAIVVETISVAPL